MGQSSQCLTQKFSLCSAFYTCKSGVRYIKLYFHCNLSFRQLRVCQICFPAFVQPTGGIWRIHEVWLTVSVRNSSYCKSAEFRRDAHHSSEWSYVRQPAILEYTLANYTALQFWRHFITICMGIHTFVFYVCS